MLIKSQKLDSKTHNLDYTFKRLLDYLVSSLLLIILSPVFVAVAIAIKLDSPGEVLFRQTRVGLNGQHFKIWKFRTMYVNSEALQQQLEVKNEVEGGILFKIKNDPRVTITGKFVRTYSLDELPQLFNVLLGHMSLIGPRPLPIRDIAKMDTSSEIRHQLLPGISGLSQVNGRSGCSSEQFFYWDKLYVQNWSLWLDFKIFLKTILVVLSKKGAY